MTDPNSNKPNKNNPPSPSRSLDNNASNKPSTESTVQSYTPDATKSTVKNEPITDLDAIQSYSKQNPKPVPIPKGMPSISDTHKQRQKAEKRPFKASFIAPKYWGIWLLLLLMLPLIYLPLRFQFWFGRQLGILTYHLAKDRRQTALSNLELAYPEKMAEERERLAKRVFVNQGIGLFETLCAWFRPVVFTRTLSISGLQHLMTAHKAGQPILLLGAHYTTVDLGIRLFTQFYPIDYVSQPQSNELLDWLAYNGRRHIVDNHLAATDTSVIKQRLKQGNIVYCSADQSDTVVSNNIMAPFFGVAAKTTTLPHQLAYFEKPLNPPAVMTLHIYRQTADKLSRGRRPHYHLTITPTLDNYPTANERADATRINETLESSIRIDPTQYQWFRHIYDTPHKSLK